jgi:hypothetical protein
MKRTFLIAATLVSFVLFACKKEDKTLSVQDRVVGDWAGALQVNV